jgi:HD-GYP domain-containing protein (c-di-GMP phosphodiesterase class II)
MNALAKLSIAWDSLRTAGHDDIPVGDGSGYPRGLKGEQIHLAARLFAVVDVWDALTSNRPYRPAWSKKDTIKYIREQAGKHFDPKIVELFLQELDDALN